MNTEHFIKVIFVLAMVGFTPTLAHAENNEVDQEAAQVEKIQAKDDVWSQQLKKTYNLTDEQLKTLHDSGLSYPQQAMVAQLAKSSQKPIEDIIKMRSEQKMGWGAIAKALGVPPREIGQAVRNLRHSIHDERKLARNERREKFDSKKEDRDDREDREDRQERHGKGHGK